MNYERPGFKSLIKKSSRKLKNLDQPPYREAMIKADKRWGDVAFWQALVPMQHPQTTGYYLNAVDRKWDKDSNIVMQPKERRVYTMLWWRTFLVSLIVTVGCLMLAYPVSHLLATLPLKYSNILPNDLRADAVLDFTAGAHCRVDGHAATGGGSQRHPGDAGPSR